MAAQVDLEGHVPVGGAGPREASATADAHVQDQTRELAGVVDETLAFLLDRDVGNHDVGGPAFSADQVGGRGGGGFVAIGADDRCSLTSRGNRDGTTVANRSIERATRVGARTDDEHTSSVQPPSRHWQVRLGGERSSAVRHGP